MIAKPPAKAELTSLSVVPPAACTYQVGQKLKHRRASWSQPSTTRAATSGR